MRQAPQPAFVRDVGTGPPVVCLHSNASTSGQWVALATGLAGRFRVLAIDGLGAGRSPSWPADSPGRFADEVDLVEHALRDVAPPWRLVGHSFGAATALLLALRDPSRIERIAIFEPTLFSLLLAQDARHEGARGIVDAATAASARIALGDEDGAAAAFIDYWMGPGAWRATPVARKPAIAASMRSVGRWLHATTTEPTPLDAFASLAMPIEYLVGERSPRSSRDVATLLAPVLPRATLRECAGVGHMAPVTHPGIVNPLIERFLTRAD